MSESFRLIHEPYQLHENLHTALINAHQRAALDGFRAFGPDYDFPAWDPDQIARIDPQVLYPGTETHMVGVGYITFGTTEQPTPIYPASILDSIGVRLISSNTSYPYAQGYIWNKKDDPTEPGRHIADDVDAPVKVLRVALLDKRGSFEAEVFFLPDSPPVAISRENIEYVRHNNTTREILEFDDVRCINEVKRAFGDEAVEPLSIDAATVLLQALQTERATADMDQT